MKDYNTLRPSLILKEYGRNMQKLVAYLRTIPDVEKRTEYAQTLVELMKLLYPSVKETLESSQKLWDDMYIMSEFDLEINGPYPMPERSILNKKPNRVGYRTSELRFKHYGRNVLLLIEQAVKLENPEEKEAAVIYIGRLMKSFQIAWNRENIENEVIIKDMEIMSKHQLTIDINKVVAESLFDSASRDRKPSKPVNIPSGNVQGNTQGNSSYQNTNRNSNNNNRKNNNRRRRPN